jgi:hypothetical protein
MNVGMRELWLASRRIYRGRIGALCLLDEQTQKEKGTEKLKFGTEYLEESSFERKAASINCKI